jgi:hypothetical protein
MRTFLVALALLGVAAASYSEDTAIKSVYLAGAAYCPETQLIGWNCTVCESVMGEFHTTGVFHASATDGQAYVGYCPKLNAVVASIRGTESLANWIENLELSHAFPVTAPSWMPQDIKIHKGFYSVYQDLTSVGMTDTMVNTIKAHPNATILIVGHSLGGAIATMMASDLAANHNIVADDVYTFGQPRVGNEAFAMWYRSTIDGHYRVTHYKDIVPHLPLKMMKYYHVATEVWYTTETYAPGGYTVCDGSGEDPKCADDEWGDSIDDHLCYMGMKISRLC